MPEEELIAGELAMVQLDSGEVVWIPMEYLQPREPESDPEDEEERAERHAEHQAERKRKHEERIEEINRMKMEDFGDLDKAEGRSGLRAKEHMEQLHRQWQAADQAGDAAGRMAVYRKMEIHQQFLDGPAMQFQWFHEQNAQEAKEECEGKAFQLHARMTRTNHVHN